MHSNRFTVLDTLPEEGETNTHTIEHNTALTTTPSIQHITKTYFKLIQATHHKHIILHALETQTFPVGMMKHVRKLTDFIKPSSPNMSTKQKVAVNTNNWMLENMHILLEHYETILNTMLPTGFPFNDSAFQTAVRWAEHRYKHRLRDSTAPTVIALLKGPVAIGAPLPTSAILHHFPTPTGGFPPRATKYPRPPTQMIGHSKQTRIEEIPSLMAVRLTKPAAAQTTQQSPRSGQIGRTSNIAPRLSNEKCASDTVAPICQPAKQNPSTHHAGERDGGTPNLIFPQPSQVITTTQHLETIAQPSISPRSDTYPFMINFELIEEDFPPLQSIVVENSHTTTKPKTVTIEAQVIHTPWSQVATPTISPPTVAIGTAQPPNKPRSSNVAVYSDLNISGPLSPDTNISTSVFTETQANIPINPTEVRNKEKGAKGDKNMMIGQTKGKFNPSNVPAEPSPTPNSPYTRPPSLPTPPSMSPNNGLPKEPRVRLELNFPSETSPILFSPQIGNMVPTPPILGIGKKIGQEPSVRLSPLPIPRHSTPTSPPSPRLLYRPTRHNLSTRKTYDWHITSHKPVIVIGDSNLSRIPPHPYKDIQIDSYPGAQFHHITGVLAKSIPNPNTKVVVLSLGINNKDQERKSTPISQLQILHNKATVMYPNATIYWPIINFSPNLTRQQKDMLKHINTYITTHYNALLEIDHSEFITENHDYIHWTPATAAKILKHWATQLKW